mmetsp:Transcript_33427/g.84460  ORF Transcript_33427/g.84460 Transcript_33427/m.84460 type:complete len:241 (+) Transcript_33427:4272-4994(+)
MPVNLTLMYLQNGFLMQRLALACCLLLLLGLHKRVRENSECELNDKEGPQNDPRDVKEARPPLVPAVLVKVHDVGPPLVGEHLKDREHSLSKIVVAHVPPPKVVGVLVPPVGVSAPSCIAPSHRLASRVVENPIHRKRGARLCTRISATDVDAWVPGPNSAHGLHDEGDLLALEASQHWTSKLIVKGVHVAATPQALGEELNAEDAVDKHEEEEQHDHIDERVEGADDGIDQRSHLLDPG